MSAAAHAPAISFVPDEFQPEWVREGVDSLAAALKIVTDLTAEEAGLLVAMVRERVSLRPSSATAGRIARVTTGLTETSKALLDLAAGETAVVVDGFKESLMLPQPVGAMADLVPRAVGTLVKMHKRALDTIGEQIQDLVESYSEGKSLRIGHRLAQVTREGVESFIQTQKTFLDEVTEQVTLATEGGSETAQSGKQRAEALVELAREGVNKFIAAQKHILDLTIERMEEDVHVRAKASPKTSMAELTRESVQKFTAAQKALLTLALNKMPLPEADAEPHHRAAKPAPRAKAAKAARTPRKAAARSRARAAASKATTGTTAG